MKIRVQKTTVDRLSAFSFNLRRDEVPVGDGLVEMYVDEQLHAILKQIADAFDGDMDRAVIHILDCHLAGRSPLTKN